MKTNETHLLVQSLSKSEKRYFRLHAAREGGEKIYTRLFDWLDSHSEFDDAALLRKMNGLTARQLNTQLQYLQEQLLNSLHQQYRNDYSSRISGQLHKAQLLRNKGMYQQCIRQMEKLLQETIAADDHLHSCMALDTIINTMRNDVVPPVSMEQLSRLFEKQQEHISLFQTETQLEQLHTEVVHLFRKNIRARSAEEQKRYDEIFSNRLVQTPLNQLQPRARIHSCSIRYIQGMYNENLEQCLENTGYITALFAEMPLLTEAMPHRYRSALYNHAKTLFYLGRNHEGLKVMKEIELLPEKYPRLFGELLQRMRIFELTSIATLTHYFKSGLIDEGMSYLIKLKPEVERNAPHLNRVNHLYILSFMQAISFAAGNWPETLHANLQILNRFSETEAPRIHFISRIVQLICHYELKNYTLLESLTRSAYRYFVKRPNPYRFEKAIIGFIRKAGSMPDRDKLDSLFHELNDQITEMQQDPLENAVHDFYYRQWLQSRIERKPIIEFTQGIPITA